MDRNESADFLRRQREALRPGDVGLSKAIANVGADRAAITTYVYVTLYHDGFFTGRKEAVQSITERAT